MKLHSKLIITVIIVIIITMGLVGSFYILITSSTLDNRIYENISLLSESYTEHINWQLINYKKNVKKLANNIVMATYVQDVLEQEQKLYPELRDLFYTDPVGKILEVQPYLQESLQFRFNDKSYWKIIQGGEEDHISKINNDLGYPAIIFSNAVIPFYLTYEQPSLQGIVLVSLPLENITKSIDSITIGKSGFILLYDQDKKLLNPSKAVSMDFSELNSPAYITQLIDFKKQKIRLKEKNYFFSFAHVQETDWTLIIIGKMDEIAGDREQLITLIILIFIISVVLIILIVFIIFNRIVSPIKKSVYTLKMIAAGKAEINALPAIVNTNDEIGEISNHYNTIVSKLNSIMKDLNIDLDKEKSEKKQIEELNRQLTQQKKQLEEMNKALELKDRYKTEFFQNISHELRTPLTLISGPLEEVLEKYNSNISEEIKNQLIIALRNSSRLLKLINQVLDLSRIDAGKAKLEISRFNLVKLVMIIKSAFNSTAQYKNISYNLRCSYKEIYTYLDAAKVEQIIINLLSNSFKFTENGGDITISITKTAHCNDKVNIKISDTGIGIPKHQLPFIFERFRQVDGSTTREYAGSGIGLAIVKEYVDLHHGEIYVQSQESKGAEFTITLPVNKENYKEEDIIDSSKIHQQEYYKDFVKNQGIGYISAAEDTNFHQNTIQPINADTVLIVEDDTDMRHYLKSILKKHCKIFFAINGEDAVRKLKEIQKPDLILSDIMMGKMDGYTLYKTISMQPEFSDIPFIFLTAKTTADNKLFGLKLGAIDYIYKPFSVHELTYKINAIIKNQKLKQVLYEKDKYASLGMLFAGISHEILNPLGGVYAPLENVEKYLKDKHLLKDPQLEKYFSDIFYNLERIEKIVKNFRYLFYEKDIASEYVDIEKLLISIATLFTSKLKERITFTYDIDPTIKITVNYNALTHILLNLMTNAIDAIPGKGEIKIMVKQEDKDVHIIVKDNGIGIKPENISKIFIPFYTEKDVGKGTGLGLYFVKILLQKIKWGMEVKSEPGKGSEFILINRIIQ